MGDALLHTRRSAAARAAPTAAAAMQRQTTAANARPVAHTTVALHSCTPAVHTTLRTTHSPKHPDSLRWGWHTAAPNILSRPQGRHPMTPGLKAGISRRMCTCQASACCRHNHGLHACLPAWEQQSTTEHVPPPQASVTAAAHNPRQDPDCQFQHSQLACHLQGIIPATCQVPSRKYLSSWPNPQHTPHQAPVQQRHSCHHQPYPFLGLLAPVHSPTQHTGHTTTASCATLLQQL